MRRDFPGILEEAVRQRVGAAGLLISMTKRQLHSHGGVKKGRLRLSKTPQGCGQVLTGVATLQKEVGKWERISAECQALQGASAAQSAVGRSCPVSALTRATDSILEL